MSRHLLLVHNGRVSAAGDAAASGGAEPVLRLEVADRPVPGPGRRARTVPIRVT